MTSPGTMKTIQKRFYTVVTSNTTTPTPIIPRVRSNSASASASRTLYTGSVPLTFFDSPQPPLPSSRPGNPHVLSTTRLPVKGDGSGSGEGQQHHTNTTQPPFSLALTSPQPGTSPPHTPSGSSHAPGHPFFPYTFSNRGTNPFYNASVDADTNRPSSKRQRARYQLDVGAYGIAKRSKGESQPRGTKQRLWSKEEESADDLGLAVQVGEDAYFIRENAMGVADGVGGWARTRNGSADSAHSRNGEKDASPSALFARRLMNYCSAEMEAATTHAPPVLPAPQPPLSSRQPYACTFAPPRPMSPLAINSPISTMQWPWAEETVAEFDECDAEDSVEELEDSLTELEEGLDVLMILERAYESALKAHVVPIAPEVEASQAPTPPPSPPSRPVSALLGTAPSSQPSRPESSTNTPTTTGTTALLSGSSTALLAVLDHTPRPSTSQISLPTNSPSPSLRNLYPTPRLAPPPQTRSFKAAPAEETTGPVLKIAHLGDCMGMLVRGEEIVWRSEEMWWSFNTPVQLGPVSPSKPSTHAQTFTIPIQQDDILILASDGLSDNLWDEEVLDEVIRMKKSFLPPTPEEGDEAEKTLKATLSILGRRTLAGMLSEALCSRARRVSERRPRSTSSPKTKTLSSSVDDIEFEVPFARRAREQGKVFRGGKADDISVVVAVISPADSASQPSRI